MSRSECYLILGTRYVLIHTWSKSEPNMVHKYRGINVSNMVYKYRGINVSNMVYKYGGINASNMVYKCRGINGFLGPLGS